MQCQDRDGVVLSTLLSELPFLNFELFCATKPPKSEPTDPPENRLRALPWAYQFRKAPSISIMDHGDTPPHRNGTVPLMTSQSDPTLLKSLPASNSRPTVEDLQGDNYYAETARKVWL